MVQIWGSPRGSRTSCFRQATSEVMRTLAIFSVFFMPITFIVGIYGMNFTLMPELNWKYGYPSVIVIMIFISVLLFFWFKKKGWYNFNGK